MKQMLNIAVFGFSLNVLDQLKSQILHAIPFGAEVIWVGMAERKIDLLLVNDVFFHSPGIQKVLNLQVSHYLRLVKNEEQAGEIQRDILSYPLSSVEKLTEWIQEKFFDYEKVSATIADHVMPVNVEKDLEHIFREIFIARNGYIQLYDTKGFVALVDCMTERVWLEQPNKLLQLSSNLNQTYATGQFVNETIKNKVALDLRTWLWRSLAEHPLAMKKYPKYLCFKLTIWPQLNQGVERQDWMKMAASFALGAKLQDVATTLTLSHQQVARFVMMAELLQMGGWIQPEACKFTQKNRTVPPETATSVRRFFGKLRKKFGL